MNTGVKDKMLSKGKEAMKKLWSEQAPLIIFLIAVVMVFLIVIIYITFAMKNSNLTSKVLTTKPIKLDELAAPFEVPTGDIPTPNVGREYSMAFWFYVDNYEQTQNHKMLFYRSKDKDDIKNASNIFMMDKSDNKMYILLKPQDSSLTKVATPAGGWNLVDVINSNTYKNTVYNSQHNKYIVLQIDYVPIQRWIHVCLVVDNKILTIYIDGEVYSVKSTDDLRSIQANMQKVNIDMIPNIIVDKTDGGIYIGKSKINDNITASSYISKVEFFNYAVSSTQLKKAYDKGPISSGGLFGSQYGFRSPVYRLNEKVE